MNPFRPIYDLCNTGDPAEKLATLALFPRMIDVEPAGLCNQKCRMCPTGLGSLGRAQGLMGEATFQRIVNECAEHGTALRFIGFGEPLLNKKIVQFVRLASDAGLLTHINSNSTKITSELAEALVDAGLSSFKASFQGTDSETYVAMRRMDFFEGTVAAIKTMRDARGMKMLPFIAASTSTTHETPEQIAAFRARLEPLVDYLSVGATTFDYIVMADVPEKQRASLIEAAALAQIEKRHPSPCPEVYDKLSIHWDGSVVSCCNDFSGINTLGNVNDTSISELWRHPIMEKYRVKLAAHDYSLPLCDVCWDYANLTEGIAA